MSNRYYLGYYLFRFSDIKGLDIWLKGFDILMIIATYDLIIMLEIRISNLYVKSWYKLISFYYCLYSIFLEIFPIIVPYIAQACAFLASLAWGIFGG